jgi:hypothetical protein
MRARRLMVVLAVLAVAGSLLLATGPAALDKDNVTARLLSPLRLDAAPGEQLTVVWALAGTDEHGRRQPFNAIGVFVRLQSASGGRPTIGFATPDAHPRDATTPRWPCPRAGSVASRSGWAVPATVAPAMCCSRWRTTRLWQRPAAWMDLLDVADAGRCAGVAGRARGHGLAGAVEGGSQLSTPI